MKLRISDRLLLGLFLAAEIKAYPSAKLFCWLPVSYSRRKYRDLTTRLARQGWLDRAVIAGEVNFRLTAKARERLLAAFPTLTLTGKKWDGFWRLAVFSLPESRRQERDRVRHCLTVRGFGRFKDSLYLSPYDWEKTVLGKEVVLIEAKQKNLGAPKVLAARIWPLERIKKQYQQVIDKLSTRFGVGDKLKRDRFFKRANEDYLTAFLLDPVLPPELLPADWPAAKCHKFLLQAETV